MRYRKITHRLWLSILLIVILSFAIVAQVPPAESVTQKPKLPNLSLNTLDGEEWKLHDNLGGVVVLNFWATWCAPCRTEIPILIKIAGEYEKKDLSVVGVAIDDGGMEVIRKFAAEYKINYPILIPPPGSPFSSMENMPTTLLIDAEGRLAEKYVGAFPEKVIRADIEKLIAGQSPSVRKPTRSK